MKPSQFRMTNCYVACLGRPCATGCSPAQVPRVQAGPYVAVVGVADTACACAAAAVAGVVRRVVGDARTKLGAFV